MARCEQRRRGKRPGVPAEEDSAAGHSTRHPDKHHATWIGLSKPHNAASGSLDGWFSVVILYRSVRECSLWAGRAITSLFIESDFPLPSNLLLQERPNVTTNRQSGLFPEHPSLFDLESLRLPTQSHWGFGNSSHCLAEKQGVRSSTNIGIEEGSSSGASVIVWEVGFPDRRPN